MAVFKEVFEALFNGHQVSLPYRLGYLEMMKYKPNENTLAYRTLEEQENHHTDGYKVSLKWRKVAIKNVKLTRFNFVSTINKEIGRRLKADGSLIYNFNTI
ncbi:MAG: hypothetical protein MJH10_11765 [Epibacterium sp.]|nr:hypothetical protein [Epibacterium sp.]NQX74223.1 hypothetical protein [Epibacterium sp.]